jgi:hypothetical protein
LDPAEKKKKKSEFNLRNVVFLNKRQNDGYSGPENRDYGRRGFAALTTQHPFYPQELALISPTSGGRSVGIFCSRTKATKLS